MGNITKIICDFLIVLIAKTLLYIALANLKIIYYFRPTKARKANLEMIEELLKPLKEKGVL